MGSVRHVADIRSDDMVQEGSGHVTLQAGTNKFASQKGMSMGAVRHVADIRADDMNQDGQGVIGLQAGTNRFATQSGMSFGQSRNVASAKGNELYSHSLPGPVNAQKAAYVPLIIQTPTSHKVNTFYGNGWF